jgi:two-component system, sensor histidine kinase PdtaS
VNWVKRIESLHLITRPRIPIPEDTLRPAALFSTHLVCLPVGLIFANSYESTILSYSFIKTKKAMLRLAVICTLCCLLASLCGKSQIPPKSEIAGYTYYHPSKDKTSWQRLNLLLSSTFIVVAEEGQVEHDTCLYIASRSLGLSRFSVLAEGINDAALFEQSQWIDRQQPGIGITFLSNTTGVKHLQLLVLLGSYYAFKPNSYYRYKDSVEYFLNKAVNESKLLKEERLGRQALCRIGKIYVQANNSKGDSIFNIVINQSKKAGDKETEATAFAWRGIYAAPTRASFQQKITDLQTASELYHNLGNTEEEINVLMDLGYMLTVTGQFEPAHEIFSKAYTLAETIRYPYTHYITKALAMITTYQGRFGEPLRYTLQTIKLAESSRDSIGWGYFYSYLSNLYSSEGREKESNDLAKKAVDRFVSNRNQSVYNVLNTVVDNICQEGRATEALELVIDIAKKVGIPNTSANLFSYHDALAGCYLSLNKLDLTEMHIRKMDSLETESEAIRGPFNRTLITDMYGYVFFKRGQYRKARDYFEKHFTVLSYGQRTLTNDLLTYRSLIATDSALGDNASAVEHFKKYTALLDSNFKVTKIRQAEELQVLYETEEKETQIAALNHQAKQTTLVKNLTLAGIGTVIIIAALLYRQNRLRRKSNKIITHQNEQLQGLVSDKEWLLKEVHHRVKNNLQIIMSLLNSQSVYIDDDAALTAINDSQRRVQAISLIHQKLYQSENTSSIDMPQYIDELLGYLKDSFDTSRGIVFEPDIEPLKLDVVKAIPLGLIINEAIVNAIKYAFPARQKGIVRIRLKHDDHDHLLLNIADNGIGLPSDIEVSRKNSLGFSLMQGLAKQLDGTFNVESNNGLHISIRFSALNNHSDE